MDWITTISAIVPLLSLFRSKKRKEASRTHHNQGYLEKIEAFWNLFEADLRLIPDVPGVHESSEHFGTKWYRQKSSLSSKELGIFSSAEWQTFDSGIKVTLTAKKEDVSRESVERIVAILNRVIGPDYDGKGNITEYDIRLLQREWTIERQYYVTNDEGKIALHVNFALTDFPYQEPSIQLFVSNA